MTRFRGMIYPGIGTGIDDARKIARRKTIWLVEYLRARRSGDRLRGFFRRRHLDTRKANAALIERLARERDEARALVSEMNCTVMLAHILQDGFDPTRHLGELELALEGQNRALRRLEEGEK